MVRAFRLVCFGCLGLDRVSLRVCRAFGAFRGFKGFEGFLGFLLGFLGLQSLSGFRAEGLLVPIVSMQFLSRA